MPNTLPERDANGLFPSFAWPGGYPLYYLDRAGNTLCPKCASRDIDASQAVTACDVHWEGEALTCDDCGAAIDSAYGVPEPDEPPADDGPQRCPECEKPNQFGQLCEGCR